MKNIFDKIRALDEVPSYSKHERFVEGIINAIDAKVIVVGDPLPSVNAMISGLGYARATVMKGTGCQFLSPVLFFSIAIL